MKKTVIISYFLLFALFVLFQTTNYEPLPMLTQESESPIRQVSASLETSPAVRSLKVLHKGEILEMDIDGYLLGVLAAEMPASFPLEALKAQAVAARSFALYCAAGSKHGEAQVCTDFACCQAWHSDAQLQEKWGENYEFYRDKLSSALEDTAGEYLSYGGEAIFAAFHSSSAGLTADSAELWNDLPYLNSVSSPESAESVPNYISSLSCSAIDFRDTILRTAPHADFTGEEGTWLGQCCRSESGRVDSMVIGGVEFSGAELRSLFSLRSTAFELDYSEGNFNFTVTGYGHGVGMSQYGAKVFAEEGSDYSAILAHYYQGAELVRS